MKRVALNIVIVQTMNIFSMFVIVKDGTSFMAIAYKFQIVKLTMMSSLNSLHLNDRTDYAVNKRTHLVHLILNTIIRLQLFRFNLCRLGVSMYEKLLNDRVDENKQQFEYFRMTQAYICLLYAYFCVHLP